MLTFTILVSYILDTTPTYTEPQAIERATNICENLYWTPYNTNENIISICGDVWEETYTYKK